MTTLDFVTLENLWVSGGGRGAWAPTMAAIAYYESGGNPSAVQQGQPYATTGWGLWQITPGDSEPQAGVDNALLNAANNAKAAVAKFRSQGIRAWTDTVGYAAVAQGRPLSLAQAQAFVRQAGYGQYLNGAQEYTGSSSSGSSAYVAGGGSPRAAIKGFGDKIGPDSFVINGVKLGSLVPPASSSAYFAGKHRTDVSLACTDVIVQRTMDGASTVALQLFDPWRYILRLGIFSLEDILIFDGMDFTLVQFTKTGDQIQSIFEASAVADLRQQKGAKVYQANGLGIGAFAQQLCREAFVPIEIYAADASATNSGATAQTIGRGQSDDPTEDSWTCLNRLATTFGWRCFESDGTIYFGPDPWLLSLGTKPYPVLREFTDDVFDIDFDWDLGKPLGTASVTSVSATWGNPPGTPVVCAGMGPYASTTYLVYQCQRDFFNPQASAQLQVPMTPIQLLNPSANTLENL